MAVKTEILDFEHIKVINSKPPESGKKPPLVFIHGMGNTTKCWEYNFLPFFSEKGYDCYALDLSNHGNSGSKKKLRWTSINDYAEDVRIVVENLEQKPILIGHSMGGLIVQKYAQKYPETIEKFILLASTYNKGIWKTFGKTLLTQTPSVLKILATFDLYPLYNTTKKTRKWFFSKEFPEEDLIEFFETAEHESFRAFLDCLFMKPIKKKPQTPPILVLGAEHDAFFSPKSYKKSFSKRYSTVVEIFPDKYHHMMMGKGWEEVAKRIKTWISVGVVN